MDELHTAVSPRAATASEGPRRVVVGVSGSIAAYKAPFVVRLLRQAGHEVKVVATESALRFIGAPALAAVSGQAVSTGVFDDPAAVEHVAVAERAELVLVAPASADLLARVRAGRADDPLDLHPGEPPAPGLRRGRRPCRTRRRLPGGINGGRAGGGRPRTVAGRPAAPQGDIMSGAGATGLLGWFADWLPLALAGGAGAACRWSVDTHVNRLSGRTSAAASASALERRRSGASPWMPWGTVVVNVTACLLMGLLVGWAGDSPHSESWAAAALTVLGTGFLGGYSTFSTACVEGARLLLAGRWGPALAHAALMTAATLGAVGLGLSAGAALR